jgi:maleylacetate reductase
MSLTFDHSTLGQRVFFGSGEAETNLVRALEAVGKHRVLLIAAESSEEVADRLSSHFLVVRRISRVVQHVPVEEVAQAVLAANQAAADVIVTIGGGSATGLGKAVARSTGLPIIAVPTTFAGSEATDVWGTSEAGRKETGSDGRVLPAVIVYDPMLTIGLPTALAVASGLNAVAHAVDGLWAPRADPINEALGMAGLRVLLPGLRELSTSPDLLAPREQVMYGAYLAAVAFASAGSGLHHKICHVLGGAFNLPHAAMHSIVLPYVTAFNLPAAPDARRSLEELFPRESPASGLNRLRHELGSPSCLADIGLQGNDIDKPVELILPNVPPSNPRRVDAFALTSIIRNAWAGSPIAEEQK